MKPAEYVLAIDAGSGSCRAALFDSRRRAARDRRREWRIPSRRACRAGAGSTSRQLGAGLRVHPPCAGRRAGGGVRAVASTSFRGGLVLFDGRGRELWACPNGDARAGAEARELIDAGMAAALQERGGDWVSLTAPARLLWLRRHEPELWGRVASVGLVNDWLTRRLTGELVTDPSTGSSSGMFDLRARSWSAESLGDCELDAGMLPAVMDAGTRIGS